MLVHTKRRLVHVLGLSRAVNELVQLHMIDTFGVAISPLTPWRRSTELLVDSPLAAGLDDLHPTNFAFDPALTAGTAEDSGRAAAAVLERPEAAPRMSSLQEEPS